MSTDPDIESILSASETFVAAPEISFTTPVEDIARAVFKHSESGIPCVITGFPLVEQSPFIQPKEWMETIYNTRGVSVQDFS